MDKAARNEEKILTPTSGMSILIINILGMIFGILLFVFGTLKVVGEEFLALGIIMIILGSLISFIICPIIFAGLKVIRPNEALVLTLFGKYYGTLKNPGFFFVNPFVSAVSPPPGGSVSSNYSYLEMSMEAQTAANLKDDKTKSPYKKPSNKISMKTMTLNNEKQKINDKLGNPIIIGIVVIWKVQNTVKAIFNVDDFVEFLSVQCDSALRNIVRMYPYDSTDDETLNEKSLRGSSQEISAKLQEEIQEKVNIAGLEIIEARITHLAYAPEIAAAMLQRQQASAIVDARQLIVDGAVGMVEMALEKLSRNEVVELDEERKAAMVSNLLVVLCGNRDAQPVVNSGSLY